MEAERWLPIDHYPYEVSSLGRVRRIGWSGRVLKTRVSVKRNGLYEQVNLSRWGKKKTFYVHRLVAAAFLPPPGPWQREVNHFDCNPSNNAASNLEWASREEQEQHKRYMESFKEQQA